MRPASRNRGFTIIELSAAVAVIAILVSLLLPALSKARYAAKNTTCKSNLRQISVATHIYAGTHAAFPTHDHRSAVNGEWWNKIDLPRTFVTIYTHVSFSLSQKRLSGVFRCPLNEGEILFQKMVPGELEGGPEGEFRYVSMTSYGYNAWGAGSEFHGLGLGGRASIGSLVERATLESQVRSPSEMYAFGNAFVRSKNAGLDAIQSQRAEIAPVTGYMTAAVYPSKRRPKEQPGFISHRGRANRLCVDGHIETEDLRKLFTGRNEQLRRWHVDNEPHRELFRD